MEPTKNNNSMGVDFNIDGVGKNTNLNNTNSEPAFRGMPKPGQPLVPTPSAADRLMNPNPAPSVSPVVAPAFKPNPNPAPITNTTASIPTPNFSQTPNSNLNSNSTPATSFKPVSSYVPPVSNTSRPSATPTYTTVHTPPTMPTQSSASSSRQNFSPFNTSGNSIPSVASSASSSPLTPSPSTAPSASSYTPPSAPSTASKLSGEVNQILNPQPKMENKSKNTLILVVSIIVALLLIGGGVYWYMFMMPTAGNESDQKNADSAGLVNPMSNARTGNSTGGQSAFPAGVRNTAGAPTGMVATSSKTNPTNSAMTGSAFAKPSQPIKTTQKSKAITPFTESERDQVSAYIESNINRLTSIRSSIPFQVTDVTFDGPDRALVQYTNGKSSYTSLAVASIDSAGAVRIVSFNLLEK